MTTWNDVSTIETGWATKTYEETNIAYDSVLLYDNELIAYDGLYVYGNIDWDAPATIETAWAS